jgi:two-component system chemotaxis sensor kinase CheA
LASAGELVPSGTRWTWPAARSGRLEATIDAPLGADLPSTDPALSDELAAIGKLAADDGAAVAADLWSVSLRFGPEVLRNGMDPLSIRYLTTLGELVDVQTRDDRLPPDTEIDPGACYRDFDIRLRNDADRATIDGVFDFMREDCEIVIQPPTRHTDQVLERIAEFPTNHTQRGDILVASTALTPA